jgi:16S rRNA (cytidine1402-2'-O)-methyltransferase
MRFMLSSVTPPIVDALGTSAYNSPVTLYVVATPIGNLEDITLRALRVLKEVKLIAAEDTRTVRHLLDKYDIRTPVTSYYEHNKLMKLDKLVEFMVAEGPVALVSEAGMPGISDPGYELVKAAIDAGEKVVPIPGPSAVTTALAASGLPSQDFVFLGFLPRQPGDRKKLLKSIARETRTLVCFEAPHRIREALADCFYTLGDRPLAAARELTKIHEEIYRGSISQAMEHFREPRGEFTLVIGGASPVEPQLTDEVVRRLAGLRREGLPSREAAAQVAAETGIPKNKLYQAILDSDRS